MSTVSKGQWVMSNILNMGAEFYAFLTKCAN